MGPVHLLVGFVVRSPLFVQLRSHVSAALRLSHPSTPFPFLPMNPQGRAKASTAAPRHESRKTPQQPKVDQSRTTNTNQNRDLKYDGFYGLLRRFLPKTHCVSPRTHHAGRRHNITHTRHHPHPKASCPSNSSAAFPSDFLPPPRTWVTQPSPDQVFTGSRDTRIIIIIITSCYPPPR